MFRPVTLSPGLIALTLTLTLTLALALTLTLTLTGPGSARGAAPLQSQQRQSALSAGLHPAGLHPAARALREPLQPLTLLLPALSALLAHALTEVLELLP